LEFYQNSKRGGLFMAHTEMEYFIDVPSGRLLIGEYVAERILPEPLVDESTVRQFRDNLAKAYEEIGVGVIFAPEDDVRIYSLGPGVFIATGTSGGIADVKNPPAWFDKLANDASKIGDLAALAYTTIPGNDGGDISLADYERYHHLFPAREGVEVVECLPGTYRIRCVYPRLLRVGEENVYAMIERVERD